MNRNSEDGVPTVSIGGIEVSRLSLSGTIDRLAEALDGRRPIRVATANLDFFVRAARNRPLARALATADLVTADGAPVLWLARLAGAPIPERTAGSDLVPALLERAARCGHRVAFVGGAPGTAQIAAENMRALLPQLEVALVADPIVRLDDAASVGALIRMIRDARIDLLLLGLGCPKQELFLERHLFDLDVKVAIGVGGTFDFLSGRRKRAPGWVGRLGLEWIVRFAQEPRRLGGRYAIDAAALPGLAWSALRRRLFRLQGSFGEADI